MKFLEEKDRDDPVMLQSVVVGLYTRCRTVTS